MHSWRAAPSLMPSACTRPYLGSWKQMHHHAMEEGGGLPTGAVLAFLDFATAYDSVCRGFLRDVMDAKGVGRRAYDWLGLTSSSSTQQQWQRSMA